MPDLLPDPIYPVSSPVPVQFQKKKIDNIKYKNTLSAQVILSPFSPVCFWLAENMLKIEARKDDVRRVWVP